MPLPRFFVDHPLHAGAALALPAAAARHVQVLRLQPGADAMLFNGDGGEWTATIARIGRREVTVQLGARIEAERELPCSVTLAIGMPANERMDGLVEKATELGVSAIQPLLCERAVLRLAGERAHKKVTHWQAVAVAACEQSGRTRLPLVAPVRMLREWLRELPAPESTRWLLSLVSGATRVGALAAPSGGVVCLSGPEGGLTPAEESAALAAGFVPVSLGPRVLRADTAPVALLAYLALATQAGT